MTTPLRTLVAASDFSFSAHRAARRAGVLAREHGAALHLLHVVDGSTAPFLLRRSMEVEVEQPLRIEAQRALESLADDVLAAGGVVNDRWLREGRVIDEVLAISAKTDLLVFGPRGVNPLRDFVIGSTAERIARRIECPMLVVKQTRRSLTSMCWCPSTFRNTPRRRSSSPPGWRPERRSMCSMRWTVP